MFGKGTKISKYLINHDKVYEAEIKLGLKTDTLDREGKILEERKIERETLEKEKIIKALEGFIGKQEQIPPMYSAIKLNGKKLYEYARNGEEIVIPSRKIEIYNIELQDINYDQNIIKIKVYCSKGTYIRSLCQDIAERLGTIGYMNNLRRLKVRRI